MFMHWMIYVHMQRHLCKIECPLHGAEFDLKSGEAVTPPATKDVKTYETIEKDGWIYINFKGKE